jgi:hypothetical protein
MSTAPSLFVLSKQTNPSRSENQLREDLLALLRKQGFKINPNHLIKENSYSKEKIRAFHSYSREEKLENDRIFIEKWFPRVFKYFASGPDIDPARIEPYPVVIANNEEHAALFRIAALWWSVPVSRGFGRRFRILIFDKSNGKLFGLLGLTDPVFNLNTRDSWIGWDVRSREKRLAHVMDAYVLGAVPPYNQLLGAKFIGLLASSDFIRRVFQKRYSNIRSIISGRLFDGRLALVTATSALGRSSIYNRLRFDNIDVFCPIGFTEGYGHFHLANGTYERLRQYLKAIGDPEVDRFKFGNGPNYRFRVVRKALEHLQLPPELLRHGVKRGVYVAPLASNAKAFLRGETKRLQWHHRPLCSIMNYWRERWLIPRASRDLSYRDFDRKTWKTILGLEEPSN